MIDTVSTPHCPECGAKMKSPAGPNNMALPVELKPERKNAGALPKGDAPCPFCSQTKGLPEWARALRPERKDSQPWRFTYRGIL
jgi:hypothetical protein